MVSVSINYNNELLKFTSHSDQTYHLKRRPDLTKWDGWSTRCVIYALVKNAKKSTLFYTFQKPLVSVSNHLFNHLPTQLYEASILTIEGLRRKLKHNTLLFFI